MSLFILYIVVLHFAAWFIDTLTAHYWLIMEARKSSKKAMQNSLININAILFEFL